MGAPGNLISSLRQISPPTTSMVDNLANNPPHMMISDGEPSSGLTALPQGLKMQGASRGSNGPISKVRSPPFTKLRESLREPGREVGSPPFAESTESSREPTWEADEF